ncbi:MAG: hypothetical protein JW776_02265 [Candidatus Lokiarchaeota archaeon]|nr:hypothetical protein [Candidatus Lokiarchaeota archaeon]
MYRNRTYWYGPGYGRGRGFGLGLGFGRGAGRGRRFYSPNCDFYPDRPRGWWAMPQYQNMSLGNPVYGTPPQDAVWDNVTGEPKNIEAIDYEILLIEKQMEEMKKEIEQLKSLKKK